jgi:hypothetical protein
MIAKMNCSDDLGVSRLLPWTVRAFSVFLLFGGMAYATPVGDLGINDPPDVLPLVRPADSQLSTRSGLSFATGDTKSAPRLIVGFIAPAEPSPDDCVFSSNCSSTIKVIEPQSLVLVGSGLLSMAGLIRRRLLR